MPQRVLIAGGGIGGLAVAIALARRGIASNVLERSAFEEETGAGIQLGPNATRALRQIGALDAVEQAAFRPEAIWIFDGLSGERLASVPLGSHVDTRYGAPYLSLHRADLHAALLAVAKGLDDLIALAPRFDVASVEENRIGVTVQTTDGREASGPCLIGADGLWSEVRKHIAPNAALRFAGATASRTLLSRKDLPPPFDAPIVGLWLGPRAHLVHYPVRCGTDLNVVAVTEGGRERQGRERQGWNEAADVEALRASFTDWCKDSKSLLERADAWRSWSLYRLAPIAPWSTGRTVLLGDAAHPVLPFLAQGAGLAIEDATALAACLSNAQHGPPQAFARYVSERQNRAWRVQREARLLGRLYHLRGPASLVRNRVLRWRSEAGLLASFDWLYKERAKRGA
jgi:salicylate hydroxylase